MKSIKEINWPGILLTAFIFSFYFIIFGSMAYLLIYFWDETLYLSYELYKALWPAFWPAIAIILVISILLIIFEKPKGPFPR